MQGLREVRCPQRTLFSEASANRLRRRNSFRASGLHHSKKNLENRLRGLYKTHKLTNSQTHKLTNLQTYKLTNLQTYKTYEAYLSAEGSGPPGQRTSRAADLPDSGPPGLRTSRRDSLFSRVFLVLVLKLKYTGFVGCAGIFWYTILNILFWKSKKMREIPSRIFGCCLLVGETGVVALSPYEEMKL